ncbi:MAG: lytic transglycosylase domain-containing protein [Pseudomonadota bacterium]
MACAAPATASPVDRWSGHIAEASARFALPPDWIRRVMRAESDGQTILDGRPIVSSAGAMGLMQLMPGTWRDMRALLGLGFDPHDPRDNILAGAAYLRLMYDRFGYPGLFAAYNAGPARYGAALSGARRFPAETRAYVSKVAGADRPVRITARIAASVTATPPTGLFAVAPADGRAPAARRALVRRSQSLFVDLGGSVGR